MPCCFCQLAQLWVVGGYLDGCLRLISPLTGKDQHAFAPTGDVITAVACKGRYLFAGTEFGDLLIWTIEKTGLLLPRAKISKKLTATITSLNVVPKTPLLIATSASGETLILNYADSAILQIFYHPVDLYPIERVISANLGSSFVGITILRSLLLSKRLYYLLICAEPTYTLGPTQTRQQA